METADDCFFEDDLPDELEEDLPDEDDFLPELLLPDDLLPDVLLP